MVLNFRLQALHILFLKDFYGVTNAPRDNGGSSNYEEKNNGMKVYSSHFLYWVLEGKKTTRSWFGNFSILPKWHFWTCAWNSNFFLAKSILLKHYENGNKKKYSQLVPGSAKSRIYSGKSTKRGFSKKGLVRIEIFFLF